MWQTGKQLLSVIYSVLLSIYLDTYRNYNIRDISISSKDFKTANSFFVSNYIMKFHRPVLFNPLKENNNWRQSWQRNSIKIVSDTCFRVILIPWLFVVRITTGLCCNWGFVDFHFLISHLSRVECNIFAFRSRFILFKKPQTIKLRPGISSYKEKAFFDNWVNTNE